MPLAGFVCCRTGETSEFGECIDNCRTGGGCVYPLPLLVKMSNSGEGRSGVGLSATELTGCQRQSVLKKTRDYYEHPDDYGSRLRGEATHQAMHLDKGAYGVIQEKRYHGIYGNNAETAFNLSGQVDWYDPFNQEIIDWKTTSKIPLRPYDEHEQQVNIYADLLWRNGENPRKARIFYFDGRRWTGIRVPIWDPGIKITSFIIERGQPIVDALRGKAPLPPRLPDYPKNFRCVSCPVRDACAAEDH